MWEGLRARYDQPEDFRFSSWFSCSNIEFFLITWCNYSAITSSQSDRQQAIKNFMQFKFETIRKTRNALTAQQIYSGYIQLRKFLLTHTCTGRPKVPAIHFHRKQLPYRFDTIDMHHLLHSELKPTKRFYWLAIAAFSFVFGHYAAKLNHCDHFRYFLFVRYPEPMYAIEERRLKAQQFRDDLLQRLELADKDLRGPVGYHNIKQALKNALYPRPRQYQLDDHPLESLDQFLKEQDKKVLA